MPRHTGETQAMIDGVGQAIATPGKTPCRSRGLAGALFLPSTNKASRWRIDHRPVSPRPREGPFGRPASEQQHATRFEIPQADPRRSPRPAATRASSTRLVVGRFVEDGLSSPSTTCEEAPFAVRATTCDDAPFVVRASLPVKSPKSLLRCGDLNRPCVPPGVLWASAHPFVPPSLARAGCLIGGRGHHRRDRTVAIGRISYGTTQTCGFRR
jgi:hypothetical protein